MPCARVPAVGCGGCQTDDLPVRMQRGCQRDPLQPVPSRFLQAPPRAWQAAQGGSCRRHAQARLPRRRPLPREPPLADFRGLRGGAGVNPPQFPAFNARPAILSVGVDVSTQLRQRASVLSLPADGWHSVRASTAFA